MLEKAVSERLWNIASFNELPYHTSRSSQRVRAADLDSGVASKVCPDGQRTGLSQLRDFTLGRENAGPAQPALHL
jgi:hypothetical protein